LKRALLAVAALVLLLVLIAVVRWLPLRTAREQRLVTDVAAAKLYRAAALTSMDRIAEARAVLRTIDRKVVDPRKVAALRKALDGTPPFILDREGTSIAGNADYGAIVNAGAGQLTIGSLHTGRHTIETTLDPLIQHAAKEALRDYRGSLVAIDPRTNEILAIVSNDPSGAEANLALEAQYEPGSIIKVLTGLDALANGVAVSFPYHCAGEFTVDGQRLDDWNPYGHGDLPDLDEALAQSCNVVFADLGVRLGADRLRRFMTAAGFDGQTDTGLFDVPLGRFRGDVANNFETAKFAIGLEHESVTTLHVAMLASMMANRGVLTAPRLLRARRSVLGEVIDRPGRQAQARIAPQEAAERMVQAMTAVVSRPEGTGRRAAIDGLPIAMKTGTAGRRADGYDAVIMAFAPVESPRIAFAIIAENAGPAEYAGAKIAHDFVSAIRERIIK
jgi:peptidoglycan glycosyltransferase